MLGAVRLPDSAAWGSNRAPRAGEVHGRAPRAGERPILEPNWPKRVSEGRKVLQIAAKMARRSTARRRERCHGGKVLRMPRKKNAILRICVPARVRRTSGAPPPHLGRKAAKREGWRECILIRNKDVGHGRTGKVIHRTRHPHPALPVHRYVTTDVNRCCSTC